jgi:hypothetical protein
MKLNGKFATLVVSLIVLVGTVLLPSHASAQSDVSRGNSEDALEGAFVVTSVLDSGGTSVIHRLFTRDGKVVAPSPSASGSTGVGEWVRTAHRQFAITFVAFGRNSTGNPAVTAKVRVSVTLNESGDELSGRFQNEISDLSGNLITTLTGTVHGVRIQVEPLE